MTKLEEVARAIDLAIAYGGLTHDEAIICARAAIAAMFEPTPEMIEAGMDGSESESHVRGIYDLMINALLAEKVK